MRIDAAKVGGDQGVGNQFAGHGGCAGGGGELAAEGAQGVGLDEGHLIHHTASGGSETNAAKNVLGRRGVSCYNSGCKYPLALTSRNRRR